MKKLIIILAILAFSGVTANAMDMSKHIGFGAWAGGVMPVNGKVNANDKLSDWVGMYGFPAVEIKYIIMDKVAAGLNLGYIYMPIKDDWKKKNLSGLEDLTPALNMPFVSLNGTFNFGPMMKAEGNKLNPFATAGVGMYMWYFSKNERTDKLSAPCDGDTTAEFKASSLGINVGAGVEYFVREKISVFGRLNYHFVMMKNKDKFGEDFANQGFLTFGAGATYYLFTGKK
jgi:opacity protein-like surface antigen